MIRIIYVLIVLLMTVGCVSDSIAHLSVDGTTMQFHLVATDLNDSIQTRSDATHQLDSAINVEYLISDHNGVIIQSLRSKYLRDEANILVEKLPVGDYTLHVLAYDDYMTEQGLVINTALGHTDDPWFSFEPANGAPLLTSPQLLYGKKPFSVDNDAAISQEILLSYLLSAVEVGYKSPSRYFLRSINNIEAKAKNTAPVFTQLSIGGDLSGEQAISRV